MEKCPQYELVKVFLLHSPYEVPVVKAAGGEITDWQGRELNINSDGTIIACGSKALHQKVLGLMQEKIV